MKDKQEAKYENNNTTEYAVTLNSNRIIGGRLYMAMATGVIHAGVCGFTINVKAVSDEDPKAQLEITSDCPNYHKIAKELTEVDAYKEIFNKLHMSRVYEVLAKYKTDKKMELGKDILAPFSRVNNMLCESTQYAQPVHCTSQNKN